MDNDRMYELLEKRINIMDLTSNYLDDKDKVDDVIQKIQSARVIDRLVDKARQDQLERRR